MRLAAVGATLAPLRVSAPGATGTDVPTWAPRPAPEPNPGFREGATVHIAPPDDGAWVLRVDDEPLPRRSGVEPWEWTPAFYAGEVTAELIAPSGRTAVRYLLDVAPHPDKTGREEFRAMIDAVWDVDPTLVLGSEPARTLVGTADESGDRLVALARLRRHAPAFVEALRELQRRPRTALREPDLLATLEQGPARPTQRASSERTAHGDGARQRGQPLPGGARAIGGPALPPGASGAREAGRRQDRGSHAHGARRSLAGALGLPDRPGAIGPAHPPPTALRGDLATR